MRAYRFVWNYNPSPASPVAEVVVVEADSWFEAWAIVREAFEDIPLGSRSYYPAVASVDRPVEVVAYRSDYTGEPRWAVKVDGRYPPELDFPSERDAQRAAEHARVS